MALPVTVYRWDDQGAPQMLGGLPSEMIGILKACLVTGYGSKQSAGWSIPFEDVPTNKVVFRNDPTIGTGGFFQIWANNGVDTRESGLSIKPALSMTALDSFEKGGFAQGLRFTNIAKCWMVIATSRSFYFHVTTESGLTVGGTSTNSLPQFFMGDIHSTIPNDPACFTMIKRPQISADYSGDSWNYQLSYFNSGDNCGDLYDTDGSNNKAGYEILNIYRGSTDPSLTAPTTGVNLSMRPVIVNQYASTTLDANGVMLANSDVRPYYRGFFPGLAYTSAIGYGADIWPYFMAIGGKQHIALLGYYHGSLWIDVESWYD